MEKRAADIGHELVWVFNNVKPLEGNQSLFIRFKYDVSVNPPDSQISGKWVIGDNRQVEMVTPIYPVFRKDLIRTFHEFEVPADAVAEDGYLAVGFLNDPQLNNTVVIFPPADGLEVLYSADTFLANYIRAVLLIFCRLIFLTCLGIFAASFLSFPVAILLCFVVFLTGTISGFVIESFTTLTGQLGGIYHYFIRPIVELLPRFDKFNPSEFLVNARLLSWAFLGEVVVFMVCIKAALLFVFSLLIFGYREIAKIVV